MALAVAGVVSYQLLFLRAWRGRGWRWARWWALAVRRFWSACSTWLVWRRWPGRRWLMATGLAVVGCALLIGGGQEIEVDVGGMLLAVGAGATYAVYTIASKYLVGERPSYVVTGYCLAWGRCCWPRSGCCWT
ncbi:MAG: hypothetical protein M5U34_42845 [Chloroflexi bacterium]|nr:hypothetical protein [Chloroflexota bacterium]